MIFRKIHFREIILRLIKIGDITMALKDEVSAMKDAITAMQAQLSALAAQPQSGDSTTAAAIQSVQAEVSKLSDHMDAEFTAAGLIDPPAATAPSSSPSSSDSNPPAAA